MVVMVANENANNSKSLFDIELDIQNCFYEFNKDIILLSREALLEAESAEYNKELFIDKAKKFLSVIKEKIKDFFNKIVQKMTEILTKTMSKLNIKKANKVTDSTTFTYGEFNDVVDYAYDKMKKYGYCSMPYPSDLTSEHLKGSYASTIEDYFESYKDDSYNKDQIKSIVHAAISNPEKSIKDDIANCKKWRDESLKEMEDALKNGKIIGDTNEQIQRYNNMCRRIMVVYMANLKGYLHNTKFRSDILNYALNKISKNDE